MSDERRDMWLWGGRRNLISYKVQLSLVSSRFFPLALILLKSNNISTSIYIYVKVSPEIRRLLSIILSKCKMQYTTLVLTILASLAAAQNAFTMTTLSTITAGTPYNITWSPSTDGTVTLILRQGSSTSLDTVETIARTFPSCHPIPNSPLLNPSSSPHSHFVPSPQKTPANRIYSLIQHRYQTPARTPGHPPQPSPPAPTTHSKSSPTATKIAQITLATSRLILPALDHLPLLLLPRPLRQMQVRRL